MPKFLTRLWSALQQPALNYQQNDMPAGFAEIVKRLSPGEALRFYCGMPIFLPDGRVARICSKHGPVLDLIRGVEHRMGDCPGCEAEFKKAKEACLASRAKSPTCVA